MFPKIWNELGTYYHDITPISRFKRIVRAHYINNYKKSIRCDNIYVVDNALKLIRHKMDPHLLNTNKIVKMEMCKGRRLTLNSTF